MFGLEKPVEEYYAPALPTGNHFSGLVYLHGSVDKPADRLILTDYDFGRAYLSEGWACRFLIDLFRKYTVLFIGYSCKDTVVQYLARGLSPEQPKAYSFATSSDESELWKALHITPIVYSVDERGVDHSALWSGLDLLARDVWSRALEHESKVRELLSGSPPPIETGENDYLVSIVRDPKRIDFFVRCANDWQWVEWADREGLLKCAFDIHAERSDYLRDISDWLACRMVAESGDKAIRLYVAHNSRISDTLWRALLWRLAARGDLTNTHVRSLLTLLLVNAQPSADAADTFIMDSLVTKITPAVPPEIALTVLRYLVTPRLKARVLEYPSFSGMHYEVNSNERSECLQKLWDTCFKHDLSLYAVTITSIIADALVARSDILIACGCPAWLWDEISYSRPEIEITPEHASHELMHTLVEVVLKCLDWMRESAEEEGLAFIRSWGVSKSVMLRRVAIYQLCFYPMNTPARVLEIVLEKQWLKDCLVTRELLKLVSKAYSACQVPDRTRFLEEAEQQFAEAPREDQSESDFEDRAMFRLLSVISHSGCSDCKLLVQRLAAIRERHPEWPDYVQPEFTSGQIFNGSALQSPISVEELLSKDPCQIVDYIVGFHDGDSFLGGTKRMNLCNTLAYAVQKSPSWGLGLGKLFLQRELVIPSDLWHALTQGFSNASFDEQQWVDVLTWLSESELPSSVLCQVSFFLSHRLESKEGQIPLVCFSEVFKLCGKLWELSLIDPERGGIPAGQFNLASRALNHPGGNVVQCVVAMALRKRNESPTEWNGLTLEWREFLETVLVDMNLCGICGRAMMSALLSHFILLDADWTQQHILPLFDWSRDPQDEAGRAWNAHGTAGRTFPEVTHLLLPLYAKNINRWEGLSDEAIRGIVGNYSRMLFWVRCTDDEKRGYAIRISLGGEKTLIAFASEIENALNHVNEDLKIINWNTWILPYLVARIADTVQPPSTKEVLSFLGWAPFVPDFPVYVSEIIKSIGGVGESVFRQVFLFKDANLLLQHPGEGAIYVTWLLKNFPAASWELQLFDEMAQELLNLPVPPEGLEAFLNVLCEKGSRRAGPMYEELRRKRAVQAVVVTQNSESNQRPS